jgi:PAS domain S-box-containing protein/diguanylate cyclase (GGDEF)-like protein
MKRPAAHSLRPLLAFGYGALALGWLYGAGLPGPSAEGPPGPRSLALVGGTTAGLFVLLRRDAQRRRSAARRLRAVVETTQAALGFADASGVLRYANPAFAAMFRLPAPPPVPLRLGALPGGGAIRDMLPASGEAETVLALPGGGLAEDAGAEPGREIALRATQTGLDGDDRGWVLSAVDVTEARRAQRRAAINEQALEMAAHAIAVADMTRPDEPVVAVNRAFTEMTGYTPEEIRGRNCRLLQGSDRGQPEIAALRDAIGRHQPVTSVLRNARKDGSVFWNELRLAPVFDERGRLTYYVSTMRDVTAQREQAGALERLAFADPLTGIASRTCFTERLTAMLAAPECESVLVAEIDVQNFQDIIGTAGYELGDALLVAVAGRLTEALPGNVVGDVAGGVVGGVVGRTGGSQFAIAVPVADEFAADMVLARLRRTLGERFVLPGATLESFFAIGLLVAERGADARTAIRRASLALHEARGAGFGETRRFDAATEGAIRGRIRLTGEMRQAVANGDFLLHVQPKVHLPSGRIIGGEALVRWQHPVFGLQPPARFIPAAEQSSLIVDIGEFVLRRAARFAVAVNRGRKDPVNFAVNVSQAQFRARDMAGTMQRVMLESGADPSWLTLELTESIFADPSGELGATLRRLRDAGFGISIDDFGTGYSSLRYLRSFPVTEIKVDRSFVSGIEGNACNRAIVEAILKLGSALGASVTAEGIETETERGILAGIGCEWAQGMLFSMPVEEAEFARLVRDHGTLPPGPILRGIQGRPAA